MKKRQPAGRQGFTLMEVLVSVGIIAIVGTVIAQSFFTMVRTNVKSELINNVKQNGDFSLDVMSRMVRNASSVTTTCSAAGTTTPSLTILNPNSYTTTFTCQLDGAVARIASVSAMRTEYLTSRNVSLGVDCTGTLTFVCTSLSNQKTQVQILFNLSQVGMPTDQFEKGNVTFQSTVTTRQ